ncbi:MAG: tRNA 5-methylaminomethyl-2-thiouridine biosynthesis bifunctional protein MnmC [Leptospiraceae bacterium]|nr:MAG: tRNA 5-methylaminomethyl-2-thiouridine biosynthesis bifunctional protein MnmC [Leptospiraceae bacterium]
MYSEKFQDIYFNSDGLEESRYVFIEGNHLPERFKKTKSFSICELGFGTGLNFLLTSKIFLEQNQHKEGRLYYYSIEKYPLSIAQIQIALQRFYEISSELQNLIFLLKNIYYPIEGFYTIDFHPRIRLTLLIGDVIDMLQSLSEECKFDAWYLDGFAPSKNPEMWQESIYQEMARLSYKNTTFATFSCAGIVKRGLSKANFIIQKRKGFKYKKEMLYGYYNSSSEKLETFQKKRIAIIGAGISGISTTIALLKRGYEVLLFDQNPYLMQGASSIPIASIMPYISAQKNELTDYTIKSYNYFISFLLSLFKKDFYNLFKDTLIYKTLNKNDKILSFIKNYKINNHSIRAYKNYFLNRRAGIIDTHYLRILIENLMSNYSDNLNFYFNTKIIDFMKDGEIILLQDHQHRIYEVDSLIFCNSYHLNQFSILSYIDYLTIRGQMIRFNSNYLRQNIKHNVLGDISLFSLNDKIYIGSSFEHYNKNLQRDSISDKYILKKLEKNFIDIFDDIAIKNPDYDFKIPTEAFIGFRCQSMDYLPVIGRLVNWEQFLEYLRSLIPNKRYYYKDIYIPEYKNIFLNTCHGTRGYTTSFLGGEIIASMIDKNPIPVEKQMIHSLSPARFVFRKWRSSQNRKIFDLK